MYVFIYLFMAVLGLCFCARAFSSRGKRGPHLIAVRGPLTVAASLGAEHRLQTRRLSNCGSRAQLLRGMWDPPRPGLEPVSPALAGRFSTTAPPGKPSAHIFKVGIILHMHFGFHYSFLKIYLFYFIYFWRCWAFVAERGLSLVVMSGGYSSLWCVGFLLQWLLLLRSTGSRHAGFSSCGALAQ